MPSRVVHWSGASKLCCGVAQRSNARTGRGRGSRGQGTRAEKKQLLLRRCFSCPIPKARRQLPIYNATRPRAEVPVHLPVYYSWCRARAQNPLIGYLVASQHHRFPPHPPSPPCPRIERELGVDPFQRTSSSPKLSVITLVGPVLSRLHGGPTILRL